MLNPLFPRLSIPQKIGETSAFSMAALRLGSLVPGPQQLWRSGPVAWKFSSMAEQLGGMVLIKKPAMWGPPR